MSDNIDAGLVRALLLNILNNSEFKIKYKAQRQFFNLTASIMSILSIVLAIFLPPLAVGLQKGITSSFWLNVLLTLIGWVPGVIHAFYTLSR